MADLAHRLRILGDPVRLRILEFLVDPVRDWCCTGEGVCACDLENYLGLGQSTVSHHMKVLRESGLVTAEKRGRWVYYAPVPSALRGLAEAVAGLARSAEDAAPSTVGAPRRERARDEASSTA